MRILLADDHDLVRETIAAFLNGEDIEEIQTVATLDDAVDSVEKHGNFDLVLLDYQMPGMNGLDGLTRMQEVNGGKPVAILSGTAPREVAQAALKAGAQGFVPKTLPARSFLTAARFMAAGEVYAPIEMLRDREEVDENPLTSRERDVLRGICDGKSNKEIGFELGVQEVTVKLHVKTLSRKLEARNRTHAAMIGRDRNLI
ncbi:response regulator transcription factor [Thalassococcus lentus]|uniref:Response regulator transcription factor n=1 Tax=Thalassococcus lentus TaxID=1210524 RepID=A0ABT4XXJ7_9RHOB|nr:response regulator transcription factor [Thalassococcus lentus]MDA7426694.1 response regulator transcription factor [Thalassococcus lentus]